MSVLRVNWRPGTASVYESIWSLQRKFGYLNRISLKLAQEAIVEVKEGNIAGDIDLRNPTLRALGEPLRVLDSGSLSRFLLPESISGSRRQFVAINIRYCEACIARGYHSPIHQLPWVAICPIHHLPLHELCLDCGKPISIFSWADGNPNSVLKARREGVCTCDIWPGMHSLEWPAGLKFSEAKPIRAYLRWLIDLESTPEQRSAISAIMGSGGCSEFELIEIWRQVLPPPKAVDVFLAANQLPVPSIKKITFPTEQRTQAVLEFVRQYGFSRLENGVIYQYLKRKEKGAWEYYSKRLLRRLARSGHGNCAQVVQPDVKKRFLDGVTIDVEKELEWICPRFELFRAIRSPTLTVEMDNLYMWRDRDMHEDSWIKWFDDELLNVELANFSPLVKVTFADQPTKNRVCSQAIWEEELCRLSANLVLYRHIAAISHLVNKYKEYFGCRRERRENWTSAIHSRDVAWPYVLVSIEDRCVIRISIWSRHKPIDDFVKNSLHDEHPSDIKAVLRRLNSARLEARKRALLERAKFLEERWRQATAGMANYSSGE